MARRRRRRGASAPFRAWGLVLSLVLGYALWQGQWAAAGWVALTLSFYLLLVRHTRCRVETRQHRPCPLGARGFLGSCGHHLGLKRGLPRVVRRGSFGLPAFMWPRVDLAPPVVRAAASPASGWQEAGAPRGSSAEPPARGAWRDSAMLWLAVAGVLVALASFLRDLVAG
ncbi:MAG: hypothetical protein ACRDSK_04780 [Actinophytocola sp.]|uniref:hypothetical protein n=1 Tax=Actinophytocola sp. TaxID=1872138 RepID=UPI003D6B4048